MRKLMLAVATAGLLCGCASQTMWVKDGASPQDYVTDSYACERDASQTNYGRGLLAAIATVELEKHCMAAHGWMETRK